MKEYDSKPDKQDSKIYNLTTIIENMIDHNQNLNHSSENMNSPKAQYPTTVVSAKKKAPPLGGGNYMKIGGMSDQLTKILWTLHQEITQMWHWSGPQ